MGSVFVMRRTLLDGESNLLWNSHVDVVSFAVEVTVHLVSRSEKRQRLVGLNSGYGYGSL